MTKQLASRVANSENFSRDSMSPATGFKLEKKKPIRLTEITFDPQSPELTTPWFSARKHIVCLNAYPNGVTLSIHKNPSFASNQTYTKEGQTKDAPSSAKSLLPNQFHLRSKDTREYLLPHGRYHLIKERMADTLELHLKQLKEQNILQDAVLYFGVTTDAFFALPRKFEVTMKCLELLEKYQPGMLIVASRSPLVLAALPILKYFGDRAAAVITIESPYDAVIQKFMPGQSTVMERLVAADGLRAQGITVNLQVSPILPYGDFYRDAWPFAELLAGHADFITLGCLATGSVQDEQSLRMNPLAIRLSTDKQYRWLRPHAYKYLFHALQSLAPEKLLLPVRNEVVKSQLSLFAA